MDKLREMTAFQEFAAITFMILMLGGFIFYTFHFQTWRARPLVLREDIDSLEQRVKALEDRR